MEPDNVRRVQTFTGGVSVAGSTVQFNDALKLLGVTLDAALCFDKRVTNSAHALSTCAHVTAHSSVLDPGGG